MRLDAETEDLSKIQVARLERSGDISFSKRIVSATGQVIELWHRLVNGINSLRGKRYV